MKISLRAALAALSQDALSVLACILLAQVAARGPYHPFFWPFVLGYLTVVLRAALRGDEAHLPRGADVPAIVTGGCLGSVLLLVPFGLHLLFSLARSLPGAALWYALLLPPVGWFCCAAWVGATLDIFGRGRFGFFATTRRIFSNLPLNLDGLLLLCLAGLLLQVHASWQLILGAFVFTHALGQYMRKAGGYELL